MTNTLISPSLEITSPPIMSSFKCAKWCAVALLITGVVAGIVGSIGILASSHVLPASFSYLHLGVYGNWGLVGTGVLLFISGCISKYISSRGKNGPQNTDLSTQTEVSQNEKALLPDPIPASIEISSPVSYDVTVDIYLPLFRNYHLRVLGEKDALSEEVRSRLRLPSGEAWKNQPNEIFIPCYFRQFSSTTQHLLEGRNCIYLPLSTLEAGLKKDQQIVFTYKQTTYCCRISPTSPSDIGLEITGNEKRHYEFAFEGILGMYLEKAEKYRKTGYPFHFLGQKDILKSQFDLALFSKQDPNAPENMSKSLKKAFEETFSEEERKGITILSPIQPTYTIKAYLDGINEKEMHSTWSITVKLPGVNRSEVHYFYSEDRWAIYAKRGSLKTSKEYLILFKKPAAISMEKIQKAEILYKEKEIEVIFSSHPK